MSELSEARDTVRVSTGRGRRWSWMKARCVLVGMALGLLLAGWAGGSADRYGEPEGVVGTLRGAYRTLAKGGRYVAASVRDCCSQDGCLVRNIGLGQQIETRLCQDKRVDAAAITVEVKDDGTAVLSGIVPDASHKETAVVLTRDTRGVARVVDQLAVSPTPRIIDTSVSDPVPTGVATQERTLR